VYQERQFPVSVAFVFGGAACLFLTVAVAASKLVLPESSAPKMVFPQTEPPQSPAAATTTTAMPVPADAAPAAAPKIEYVNLVEPAQVLAVSDGLTTPRIAASAPDLAFRFAPITRSTGWQSARPSDTPEILAALGNLELSTPALRDVSVPQSDQRASVTSELLPVLRFDDLVGPRVLRGADEPAIQHDPAAHRLASHGPTTANTLFPSVLVDPLPEQEVVEQPTAVPPEVPTETAQIDPIQEPTVSPESTADTPTYALKPRPRPAERPVLAETPKDAEPKPSVAKVAAISEVSVAGSKRVAVVGVFQTRSASWALLALDNGQIVKVTNGTKLSNLRVSRIRGDKIWIRVGNAERSLRAGEVIRVN
jgi:hypothetical protein